MKFTIPMSATVVVTEETAVILAAARVLGTDWANEADRAQAFAEALSSIASALGECIEPAAAFDSIPGVEVLLTTVDLPVPATQ